MTDPHPADCNSSLPSGTVIVSNLSNPAQNVAGCTSMNWSNAGGFSISYAVDANGNPVAQIDTHQLGVGFGGHIYFAHNRTSADTANLVTGTWNVALPSHLYNVYAHVPSTGGTTDNGADGSVHDAVISQHTNQDGWVSLGYYALGSNATVSLGNITTDAVDGAHDVAWDSVAFVPISGTQVHHTFDAVSVINPAQSLDTNTPSSFNTPLRNMQTLYDWGIERTVGGPAWNGGGTVTVGLENFPTCSGTTTSKCIGAATKAAATQWGNDVKAAGATAGGNGTMTPARLMGFANNLPNPAATPDQAFASDTSYKLKTHVDITWIDDSSGKIVDGSEQFTETVRLGNTQIAPFVQGFMQGVQTDYGVPIPNLAFSEVNAHTYTGDATAIGNPLIAGFTPAQAYMPHAEPPALDTVNNCVKVRSISGGVDAYRPLDTESNTTDANASAWVQQIQNLASVGTIPQEVADTAGDIYSMFFRATGVLNGSLLNFAPPIWQQIAMEFCGDGSVRSGLAINDTDDNPQYPLVAQGYMPDLYLYLDGKMVNQSGQPATSAVQAGNFANFSNIPGLTNGGNAYSSCNIGERANGGNPWNVSVPPFTTGYVQPNSVINCDDLTRFFDSGDL